MRASLFRTCCQPKLERAPQISTRRKSETCRHDAHHRIAHAIQSQSLPDDVWRTTEFAFPQSVAHDQNVRVAGLSFLELKDTAQRRLHAHQRKKFRRDCRQTETLRRLSIGKIDVVQIQRRYLLEDVVLRAPINEIRR